MRFAITLCLSFVACSLPAQRDELTHELGLDLLVEVQSTHLSSSEQPESPLSAAGTIVGVRKDTVYVVTSYHHVRGAAAVQVRLTPKGPLLPAPVRAEDPALDFAVLAVIGYTADAAWSIPTRVVRHWNLRLRESAFVIGCPEGVCWVPPERGVLSEIAAANLRVRTLYIREGVSGGPVVDEDGALIGIVVRFGIAEGTAVRWDIIEPVIRRLGYPVNLPEVRGPREGEVAARISMPVIPRAAVDAAGRWVPGWRGEISYRVTPWVELAVGITSVSFAEKAEEYVEVPFENYAGGYFFVGARWSSAISPFALGRGFPDVISGGLDLLMPVGPFTAVQMLPGDSVDLSRGEYVNSRQDVSARGRVSFAIRGSYRIALNESLGVSISPALYLITLDRAPGSTGYIGLEIGADFMLFDGQ